MHSYISSFKKNKTKSQTEVWVKGILKNIGIISNQENNKVAILFIREVLKDKKNRASWNYTVQKALKLEWAREACCAVPLHTTVLMYLF